MKIMTLPLSLLFFCAACGSSYTIIDRTELQASPNSTIVATTLLPNHERRQELVKHLALAEEVYQKQLGLLRERRNKVRARKRDLNFASFGVMGLTGLGVGGAAIGTAAGNGDNKNALIGAGVVSLIGLGIGTILQLTGAMQEETSVADDKVRSLQRAHAQMIDQVRVLSQRSNENPVEAAQTQAQIAGIVEGFINETLQTNVKG